MRICLAAVGRFGGARRGVANPERALFEHYAARIVPQPVLKEVMEKRPVAPAELKRREAALLRDAMPAGAVTVALDSRGKALSSAAFAERLGTWRDDGVADLAFVIGGAEGLDRPLVDAAALVLSLGPMTWPHLLVRGLLAEQLYRAQCILSGHPYHRA